MGSTLWLLLGLALGLAICWAALVLAMWRARPSEVTIAEAARLLPDVLRLVGRLARDRELPRRVRVYLWLLLGYLALPFDLVPDFIPVIGYADDALVVALVLRTVVASAGAEGVRRHWTGSAGGLSAVLRLAGLGSSGTLDTT